MLFELSKDKSLLSLLSKADLDENTNNLVKNKATPTEIKKSLIENINSTNLVEYRKFIKKAEEEEENFRERKEREITDAQKQKIISLLAQQKGISEEEVNLDNIPKTKKEARKKIKEITDDLKTQKDIGGDEEPEDSLEETDNKREAAKRKEKDAVLENKKKEAEKNLNKATKWLEEVEDLVQKLDYSVSNKKVNVKRLAEYQKFGNNIGESNEVISLVMLYERNEKYLSDKYSQVLENYDFGKGEQTNILMPYKELKNTNVMMPVPKKAIFVNDLDSRWSNLTKADYQGVKLSDILKEMHRKRHGKQPIVDRKDSQRKEELQRLQRFIAGESPKDSTKFKKLLAVVKDIRNKTFALNAQKNSIEDNLKTIKGMNAEEIAAERIQRISRGIKNLEGVEQVKSALETMKDIQENPAKYAKEFKNSINEKIESLEKELEYVNMKLEKQESFRPVLQRVNRILGEIDNARELTGKEPIGEVKRILGKLTVHIIRIQRVSNKLYDITQKVDEETDDIIADLQQKKVISNTVNIRSVESLAGLTDKFEEHKQNIDSILNEYDNLIGD